VQWHEGKEQHEISGHVLASMIWYARERSPYTTISMGRDVDAVRVVPMLRGLGGLLFPDAGEPHPDLEGDQRFFVTETLNELAAAVGADAMGAETGGQFRVVTKKKAGRR
jgi:hypothetical protein